MGSILRGGAKINNTQPIATALRVQSSVNGQPIPFLHGQQRLANNLLWYGNFTYTGGSGSGKGGKGGVTGGSSKGGGGSGASYSASFMCGLCEGPIDAVLDLWDNKTPQSLASQGFSAFDGYQGQTPWSYLESTDPTQAITYSSLAYTAVANYSLGNQPELPNFNFEVRGAISGAVTEVYAVGSPYVYTASYFSLANSTVEYVTVPASPYQYTAQNAPAPASLPVILASMTFPFGSANGVVDTDGNVYESVPGAPSAGQYNVDSTNTVYTFAAADEGVQVIIIDVAVSPGVSYVYQPTATTSSGSETLTSVSSTANLAPGMLVTGAGIPAGTVITDVGSGTVTVSQAATASASGVTLTCWGAALTQVNGSPGQGQFSVSVGYGSYGQYTFSPADDGALVGIIDVVDADPSVSVVDYLTNPRYGVGFPLEFVGSMSALQTYAFANGLFISPVWSQVQTAQSYFGDFSSGLNGEFVWSTGLLNWYPYGDTQTTGYGFTYVPAAAPLYSLDDDDFLKNEGTASVGVSAFTSDDPVVCARKRPSDAYNDVKLEYLDRGNSYNPAIVEAQDDAAINAYGLRPADVKTLHFFCNIQSALTSAQLQLGRQAVRNMYTFTVPWYYILLDPMDIVAITDANLGLDEQWVRILEITENQQDSTLTISAEEYLEGTGAAPLYGTQSKGGYAPNYNADPGPALAPIVFEVPVQIATNSGLETWLVTGGGSSWGGADVYLSTDNQTYKLFGRYQGSSRMGVNSSDFPSGPNPDTADTLAVSLTTVGELYSATSQTDAQLGHTLCYEGGYPNPAAPTLSPVAGGSLGAEDYYVRVTYVFAGGEGPPSPEDSLEVPANHLLQVASPAAQAGATGWNVYVGLGTGEETKQNSVAVGIGTAWAEPTSGLVAGGEPPNSETSYELVSYQTATPTGGGGYDLGTYIERGMYNTTISDHPAGSQFARLDGSQMVIPYDKSQIGTAIYIKLLSFNPWNGGEYDQSAVQPFVHIIEGPPLLAQVQNFSATQSGGAVAFGWTDLAYEGGLKGYDILYAPMGDDVSAATLLTEAARGTEMTNASVPPGSWTFYIRGHDIADQLGPTNSVDLVVTNQNFVIADETQEPTWLGALVGCYAHYTGILCPDDQNDASFYATLGAPPVPTLGSAVGGALGLTTYYVKTTYVDATGETVASPQSSLAVAALHLLTVASPAAPGGTNQGASGWNVYVSTSGGAEELQNASPIVMSMGWTEPAGGLVTGAPPPASDTTGWEVFDSFVPTPVAEMTYTAPTLDTGYDDELRVYSTQAAALGAAGESGAPASLGLSIDTWLTGGSDPDDYVDWTIGFKELRYLSARLTYSDITAGNVSYVTDFTVIVDNAPQIENNSSAVSVIAQFTTTGTVTNGSNQLTAMGSMAGVVVGLAVSGNGVPAGTTVLSVNVGASSLTMSANGTAAGGSGETVSFATWVAYPTPYHTNPNVVVTAVSGSASTGTSASATNETTQGFSPFVWNGTTNIAGVVNWQATGD
jgi:hypothetical protein